MFLGPVVLCVFGFSVFLVPVCHGSCFFLVPLCAGVLYVPRFHVSLADVCP